MANIDNEQISGQEKSTRVFKTREDISLTDITLGLIGPTHKGPAFVPQTHQTYGLDVDPKGLLNTFENQFGSLEELGDHNLMHYSAYEWFNQGGSQLSSIRVLGTGDNCGFYVGEQPVSGSNTLGKQDDNSFSSSNSQSNGGTHFIGHAIENNQFITEGNQNKISSYNDYLQQIGYGSGNTYGFVLTECLFEPHGIKLYLEKNTLNPRDLDNAINSSLINSNKIDSVSLIDEPKLIVRDLSNVEYRYTMPFNLKNLRHHNYSENEVNRKSRWNLHKGHLNYASWGNQIDYRISSSVPDNHKVFLREKTSATPDYNNFRAKYQTAETPWIVSQPLDREGIDDNRINLHKKCIELFKFVSLDDGEIGNRFRIRVTPQRAGNRITKDWAKFSVVVWEYDKASNSFNKVLEHKDLDLNADSPDYIARVFGTKHEYYNEETKKVQTDGIYENTNNFLRVVVNSKVEYGEVDTWNLIPCGFKPYPRIDTANLTYETTGVKIIQKPIEYASNLLFSHPINEVLSTRNPSLSEDKYWGVMFDNNSDLTVKRKRFAGVTSSFDVRVKRKRGYEENTTRRFAEYAKYFQDSLSSGNVWIRDLENNDIDPTNSFFHLEKVLKEQNVSNSSVEETWLYSMYRRDGLSPTNIASFGAAQGSYAYINIEEELVSDDSSDSINSLYLSFDFFTCGGFDGLNILDHDKHMMNQSALIREIEDEKNNGETSGTTRHSYELAHDIIVDDANAEIDILLFPLIGHNTFNKKVSDICNSNERYVSILNTADFYTSGINLDANYHVYDPEVDSPFDSVSLLDNVGKTISDGTRITMDSVKSAYFNGKYSISVCNSIESTIELEKIPHRKFTNMPSFSVISSLARSLSQPLDSISNFNESRVLSTKILNTTFNDSFNNEYSNIIKDSLKNNVNFIISKEGNLSLNSANTSVVNRNSLNRFIHNVRIMIDIKKKLKYLIFQTNVLFNNNSSLDNLIFTLNANVENLLQGYVNSGAIRSFYVKNSNGQSQIEKLDMQKNILRGSIAISLFGKTEDVIEDIRIADLLNSTQNNLTAATDLDIIIPTI